MAEQAQDLGPVRGEARIDVLDVMRGMAILGIFFMNIPLMGQSPWMFMNDIRSIGWSPVDQGVWYGVQTFLEGTQRGLLQLLFGAGMMVLTARAMTPDGPVAVADLYLRRNLWLCAFGLLNIFLLLWPGDILLVYGLAALFLFPFRKLGARWLLLIGLGFAAFTAVGGAFQYAERAKLVEVGPKLEQRAAAGQSFAALDKAKLEEWRRARDRIKLDERERREIAKERQAYSGGVWAYVTYCWGIWFMLFGKGFTLMAVAEAFCAMLIGVALWKWGVIQGGKSRRFYLVLMLGCYGFGLVARAVGAGEIASGSYLPRSFWITSEAARLATTMGHLALINLAMKGEAGRRLLAPFKAAGRTAFSLYLSQQVIGNWILFAPFALGLWGEFGHAGLAAIALAVVAAQLVAANLWVRRFANGPVEWLWRTLAYLRPQPFRRPRAASAPAAEVAPVPA